MLRIRKKKLKDDELYDYTFGQYLVLPIDERDKYKTYGLKAKGNSWGFGDALEWEWGRIKQIQDIINQPSLSYDDMIEILCIASKLTSEEIYQKKWHQVFKFYNFVVKEIEKINELEKQLSYEPDTKEINAGIENYKSFGWFVTLNRLAGGDPLKYDAIGEMPYSVIFATLKLQAQDAIFNRNLIKQNNVRSS